MVWISHVNFFNQLKIVWNFLSIVTWAERPGMALIAREIWKRHKWLQIHRQKICKLIIISSRKWFRANELPLMSPCPSPLLCRNFTPLSLSFTKTKHFSSAIIGHAPSGNCSLCCIIWSSSVPPENEISFNYTNDEDDNSHGKGHCTNWNLTFWGVGYIVGDLVGIAFPV